MGTPSVTNGRRIATALVAVAVALTATPAVAGATGSAAAQGAISPIRASLLAQARTAYPIPAAPVQPEPCPPPPIKPSPPPPPLGPPAVPEASIPLVGPPRPRHVSLAAISGKGIWLTVWPHQVLNVKAVVATARSAGLHQLWIRTGSSQNGFYGGARLKRLVAAAHAAGIAVIAWDFPTLSNPAADARRAASAFGEGVDAFSPDIEAAAEGTHLTARRVRYYLSLVREIAGNRPVIATVPAPDSYWLTFYPYNAEAPYVDAFAPMVYWACTEPGAAVEEAVAYLSKMRPVAPIGQDYNMGPEGGPPGLPTPKEIWRFLYVAKSLHTVGASLYDFESGGPAQLKTLAEYPWSQTPG